jgi:hypothetical protein
MAIRPCGVQERYEIELTHVDGAAWPAVIRSLQARMQKD